MDATDHQDGAAGDLERSRVPSDDAPPAGAVGTDGAADDGGGRDATGSTTADATPSRRARLEEEGDVAADYLEELLDIADLDGDLDIDVTDDRATVSVLAEDGAGAPLQRLVGPQGQVLDALQELTRLAVQARTGERSRLVLDVDGYRGQRRAELERLARAAVAEVRAGSAAAYLAPMNPYERKIVHDVVADEGLASESQGLAAERHVVVTAAG